MIKRVILLVFFLLVLFILNAFLNPIPKKKTLEGFKPSYGVTYSFEQAGWYGLNPRMTYIKLLDEVGLEWVRLPFFWDQMVDEGGNFNKNFDDLKFAVLEAEKRNIKVVVAMGAKTPYYPEYHLPESTKARLVSGNKIGINHPIAQDVLMIDRRVVEELSKYSSISHWQIENEPFTPGGNGWTVDLSLIAEELNTVRAADSKKRPIILSHVGPAVFDLRWKMLLAILEDGDVLGVNAYFKTQAPHLVSLNTLGKHLTLPWPKDFSWPVQSWGVFSPNFEGIKKEAAKKGVDLWVLEMQAEPYIRTLEDARRVEFVFSTIDVIGASDFLRDSRIESVGLWGAPFWMFRDSAGDSSWLTAIKSLVN